MCEMQYLSSSEGNYIAQCKQCDCYQICFGNMFFSITPKACGEMHDVVKGLLEHEPERQDAVIRRFVIPTPYSAISLFLSLKEVQELDRLLEDAENEAIALSLMDLLS